MMISLFKPKYTPLEIITMPAAVYAELREQARLRFLESQKETQRWQQFLDMCDELQTGKVLPATDTSAPTVEGPYQSKRFANKNQFDCIVTVLREAGEPLHLDDIAVALIYHGWGNGEKKPGDIYRSVSSHLSQWSKGDAPTFRRVNPGVYELAQSSPTVDMPIPQTV